MPTGQGRYGQQSSFGRHFSQAVATCLGIFFFFSNLRSELLLFFFFPFTRKISCTLI